jgi:hypothetical protein
MNSRPLLQADTDKYIYANDIPPLDTFVTHQSKRRES